MAVVPTIEVKPTIVVSPAPKERCSLWQIAGVTAAATIPIIISAIALVFSVLGYRDQHQAYKAAESASRQAYALRVSDWVQGSPRGNGLRMVVENQSNGTIQGVIIQLSIRDYSGISAPQNPRSLLVPDVPPCSIAAAIIYPKAYVDQVKDDPREGGNDASLLATAAISFTDPNGVLWQRPTYGPIRALSQHYLDSVGALKEISTTLTPAQGCS